ncbi:MAG: hypothetical protein R3C56_11595 [Pirellulaceae bacterium]
MTSLTESARPTICCSRELEYRLAKLELDAARDATAGGISPVRSRFGGIPQTARGRRNHRPSRRSLAARPNRRCHRGAHATGGARLRCGCPTSENQSDPADATAAPSDEIDSKDAANQASVSTQESDAVSRQLAALRACELLENLQRSLKEADRFYSGYDPNYTWWVAKPMERLSGARTSIA